MANQFPLQGARGLGSTSYVTDADGNIAQHVEYIPYGEVFVEERNNSFSTNYLFNAKELDNETGLYYYGARYLDPTGAMWLSVDPLFEKYAGMSPYSYCAGNPVKMVDPDGRELMDIFKGAIAVINDNIMLGVGDYRGRMGRQAVDASDYNLGLIIGDCLSVLIGSGEIGTGTGMMAQGVVVTGASVSGGVTAPVAVVGVGKVVAGAAHTEHGFYMAAQGASNLANKKGHLPESKKQIESDRRNAVNAAWKEEKNLVEKTGRGTRLWNKREKKELLETGKVKGYEEHHINSVKVHPELAKDPNNISFVKGRKEHLQQHNGNFRNPTEG
ncbi:MAG: hypothetical protein E7077_02470 [Bacteroidales bacterium]|nr:hypothetical protein [Bacteroidales bacterium]